MSGVTTQVSLDLTTIPEALELARGARRAGVDWLEAGTPLILGEGLHAVGALKGEFPGVPIVADLKTMDGAGLEAEMMLGAGATHVVVMSRAHWASVKEMVKIAHGLGGEVMADVLGEEDKAARARTMEDLGVDWIILHTGFDERRYVKGVSPLDDLDGPAGGALGGHRGPPGHPGRPLRHRGRVRGDPAGRGDPGAGAVSCGELWGHHTKLPSVSGEFRMVSPRSEEVVCA
jgi:3-keto-L-gulonate-6-phosphate decarboxylase